MKCIILCFILICSMFTSFAQKIQDFENGFFSEWGTNGNVEEYPNSKFEIVENICKKGLNSTEKCAKMSRYGSGNGRMVGSILSLLQCLPPLSIILCTCIL